MKALAMVLAVILMILSSVFAYTLITPEKEHVGGNVLNMQLLEEVISGKDTGVAPAWIDNGFVYHFLFRPLVLANTDLTEFKPDLAESFTVSDNGLVYTFKLKERLKWSDGKSLTVDDVVFSLETAISSPTLATTYAEALHKIKNIEINGDEIAIHLHTAHNQFLHVLSQFFIFPKHHIIRDARSLRMSKFWENPVGCGMYMLTEKTDSYYKLERNPHYIGVKPKIDTILLHKEDTGNIDIYLATEVADILKYQEYPQHEKFKLYLTSYRYFAFNIEGADGHENPAMQDINVRTAICYAIDNLGILDQIYHNNGHVIAADTYHYNSQTANSMLRNAGYDFTRPLKLGYAYTENDATSMAFLTYVTKNLEDAGFIVEHVKEASTRDLVMQRNFDIMLKDIIVLQPRDWHLELASDHQYSRIYGTSGAFDELIAEASTEQDPAKQVELSLAMNLIGAKELRRYPILSVNQAMFVNTQRIKLPEDFKFGNPWYVLDINFEECGIARQF